MNRVIITSLCLALLLVSCKMFNSITQEEAEQIALNYIADQNESSHWHLAETVEQDQYWAVRFEPVELMPEVLLLIINRTSGEIANIITDS